MTNTKDLTPEKTPHFCYQCGNRIIRNAESCWYCAMPVHREIRRLRRCPFCAEPVRREAVKCRHCGEFLDGRPHADLRPVQQMIVIDKDLLQAMSDVRLFPGIPVPDVARAALQAETVRAIEENRTGDIKQPGVKVLPAPSATPILLEYKPAPGDTSAAEALPPALARPPRPPARAHQALPPARWRPPKDVPSAPEADTDVADAEFADIFRICSVCGTEILALDNFCYHCGTQYHRTVADKRRERTQRRQQARQQIKIVLVVLLLALAGWCAYLYYTGALTPEKVRDTAEKAVTTVKEKLGSEPETPPVAPEPTKAPEETRPVAPEPTKAPEETSPAAPPQ